eukprot:g14863.t1
MRWLSRGKSFAKTRSAKEDENLDSTMDTSKEETNAALAIARENERERGEAKQIERRILLTEMAAQLRVALFAEIFCPTQKAMPAVSCSGSDIIHNMINLGFAASPEDAVLLANRLVLVGALIGVGGPSIFVASEGCRYRFAVDRYALFASVQESDQLVDGTRVEGAMRGTSSRMLAELAQSLQHPTLGVLKNVDGQGRLGFAGKDVVRWLMNNDIACTRQDAVCIGSALVRSGIFFADHRNFVDGETRYFLAEDSFMSAASAALRN